MVISSTRNFCYTGDAKKEGVSLLNPTVFSPAPLLLFCVNKMSETAAFKFTNAKGQIQYRPQERASVFPLSGIQLPSSSLYSDTVVSSAEPHYSLESVDKDLLPHALM